MTTTSLFDIVRQQLGPDAVQQISRTIGADENATSNAIAGALPALLGGLSRNAAHPDGAAAIEQALGDHDGSILGNLGGLLTGTAAGGTGGSILGHIFGPKQGPVTQGLGKASGLDAQQIGRLLTMLAPIVMAALGRMKRQGGIDASQLPSVLQESTQQAQSQTPAGGGFDLSSVLDANHDGHVVDDVARMGKAALGDILGKNRA